MKKIIIIGSGLGGLVAGNLLAKKGHRVTILESHNAPGGYTAGFRKKGFYFESGTLSFESSATVFKAMMDIGVFDKIDFVRQKTRSVSSGNDCIISSYEEFKKIFYSSYKGEKENLDRYFSEVDLLYKTMGDSGKPIPYLLNGFPFFMAVVSYMLGLFRNMKVIRQYSNMTVDEFTEKFFKKNTKIYRHLASMGYPQMSALIIGGALVSMIDDYWTVRGGMQSWADTLADNFKHLGGELLLKSYVNKIITRDGAVYGVVSDKKEYGADCVIAACDYKKTFLDLLDDTSLIGPDKIEKIKRAEVSEGVFTAYLGLRMSNEELRRHMQVPHVILYDEKQSLDVNSPDDRDFFKKNSIMIYSPSLVNPDHAAEGKSSLMIQSFTPHNWMQNWGGGDKKKYRALKEQVRKTLIDKAGKIVPNLKKYIIFEDAATPLTYERYTHNSEGATSAWSWNPNKKFYDHPFMSAVDTPVKNLYIGSCWASQIGGIPGAISAAYLCAKKIRD